MTDPTPASIDTWLNADFQNTNSKTWAPAQIEHDSWMCRTDGKLRMLPGLTQTLPSSVITQTIPRRVFALNVPIVLNTSGVRTGHGSMSIPITKPRESGPTKTLASLPIWHLFRARVTRFCLLTVTMFETLRPAKYTPSLSRYSNN